MKVTLQIVRKEKHDSISLNVDKKTKLLDLLQAVKEKKDPSLTFRSNCTVGLCGSCTLHINGVPRLSCSTTVEDVVSESGEILIEPLKNRTVVKDLVTDETTFFNELAEIGAFKLRKDADATQEVKVKKEDLERFNHAEDCNSCGACTVSCSAAAKNESFLGPAAMTKAYRLAVDTRDSHTKDHLKKAVKGGLWKCAKNYSCTDVCPQNCDPSEKIEKLRSMSIEESVSGDGNSFTTSFADSATDKGTPNWRSLKPKGKGALLVMKGKAPSVMRSSSKNKSEIKKLAKKAKRLRKLEG